MHKVLSPIDNADDEFDPFAGSAIERVVPTTESQREIWLATQLGREASLAYNQVTALRLSGNLQVTALGLALQALAARHESLRTTLTADGMSLLIAESIDVPLQVIHLGGEDEVMRQDAIRHHCTLAVETPFDLMQGPLLRAQLLTLDIRQHILILVAHHVVCDGWSLGVIERELAALYGQAGTSPGAGLPPACRFSDYATLEAAEQDDPSLAVHEQYWLSRFQGELPRLGLPLDNRRPAVRSFASRREDRLLDTALVADLRRMAAGASTSLFSVLAGGFAALLGRLSGQSDVVIGVPSAGQSRCGMHSLVGHCVNLLPIRFQLEPGKSAAELVAGTRDLMLDALEHQQYTFGTLLQKLQIPRDASRVPLVSVMFNLDQPSDLDCLGSAEIRLAPMPVARHFEAFELFLNISQTSAGLRLECQFNADLFTALTVQRWLAGYETLLRGILQAPGSPLKHLPALDPEQSQTLALWNRTGLEHDRSRLVHDLIESRALADPARTALVAAGRPMTYGALWSRASQLARALRARGLGRGMLVGLCLERGLDMVVAQLGILKSGAAYVPLDPGYPADRLAHMVQDAGLAAVVTQSSLLGLLDLPAASTLLIDSDAGWIGRLPDTPLAQDEHAARPEDPAYVIYTSGSTGKPKGTLVPHRSVVNFLTSMAVTPGLAQDDVLVAVTTLSFDIAVLELLLPLTVGAQVVLATRDQAGDGNALRQLIASSHASIMQATPSTWRLLIEAGWEGNGRFKALVGGEALAVDLAQQLLARSGEVWNMYGPTETTVWSTCWRVEAPQSGISIGTPIANTTVRILDEGGQLCPIGVAGEIYIGGEGVAIGYLNRPELTAERFVRDGYDVDPQARLYRTGDRGRWRHDGRLEHLGRLDHQVKVRGHRIELGEIETNLSAHPDISHCVVLIREDRPADVRIVAYSVANAGSNPSVTSLRDHLRRALPDYMIPQHFMQLDELPLLPNGKINRGALPAPEASAPSATEQIAPRSETEAVLAGIWSEVLGVERVGVHDSFFDLGGHSLLALKLSHRIEQHFRRTIRLATLFDAPTVGRLALLLSGEAPGDTETCAVAINAGGSRAPLFFVSGWGGAIMGFKTLARQLHPEQPLHVLDTTKFGSATHPIGTLPEIAAQMVQDMRRIQPQGPYHLCGFSQGGKFVYEMAQELLRAEQPVGLLALMDCDAPGYPRTRPPISRLLTHLRMMLRQGWCENLSYLGARVNYFYRRLTRQDNDLFSDDADVAASSAAQAIQASADAMSRAWEDYTPSPYPGRMLLITAAIRDVRPSVIDDDPLLGWKGMIGEGIVLRSMKAHHVKMIAPDHAAELAGVLSEFLEQDPASAGQSAPQQQAFDRPAGRPSEVANAVS